MTEAWFCWLNRSFMSRALDPNCNTAHRLVVTLITKTMVPYQPCLVTVIHLPEDRTSFDLELMLFVYWNRREIKVILSYPAETQLSPTVWRISLGDCRENIQTCHDDVIKWKHFSRYCPFVRGPVPGEFPAQRPVTRSFDVFFDLRLNKQLGKQSWGW